MFYSRVFARLSFIGFALALYSTLRVASQERGWPVRSGNVRDFEEFADRQPDAASSALRAAVRLDPRDSTAWIALGLAAEWNGDMQQAADCLLQAEKVDRQYLPAWTSANFFFRRGDDQQFWRAAKQAAAMSYDDPAPLIELADRLGSTARATLERLGDSAHLERGYLRYLITQSRWPEAEEVAFRLSARAAPSDTASEPASDRALLLNLIDHLIAAKEAEGALAMWNGLPRLPALKRARRDSLVNEKFEERPSGLGFDWHIAEPPRGGFHWEPSKLEFSLLESTAETCTLLKQWVVLHAGRHRLRFRYRTEGLAQMTGLRWNLLHGGQVEASSAVLTYAAAQVSNGVVGEWNFRAANAGLYELAWVYGRVPGTVHQEGRVELNFAVLEAP